LTFFSFILTRIMLGLLSTRFPVLWRYS